MHTPDGFLTSWICYLMLFLVSVPLLIALNNLKKAGIKKKAISIATVTALIFLAQMLNFPIASGTSGHLIGAAFALIVLGLDGAVVAISAVLLVQALVFGDGGMLALGANIFNMAIVGVYSANFVYARLSGLSRFTQILITSWISVMAATIACTALLSLSGTVDMVPALIAMTITHVLIGVGEGLITFALVSVADWKMINSRQTIALTGVSFLLLAALLPFASNDPDGLESVAIRLGFYANEITVYSAPLDYSLLTGIIGAGIAFALLYFGLNVLALSGDTYDQKTQTRQENRSDEEKD